MNQAKNKPYPKMQVYKPTISVGPSLTQQHFEEQTNMHKIMQRYRQTGTLPMQQIRKGIYADLTEIPDYYEAQRKIRAAGEHFLALPSSIRARFGNDPGALLAFVADEKNREEAVEMGLIDPPQIKPATMAEIKEALADQDQSSLDVTGPGDTKESPNNTKKGRK